MSGNKKFDYEGKFMSTVKVGPKCQIVIPKGARELFGIEPGDTLLLLADKEQGIALMNNGEHLFWAKEVFRAYEKPEEIEPDTEENK